MPVGEILSTGTSECVCARQELLASFALKRDENPKDIITNFSGNTEGNQKISKSNLYNLPELWYSFQVRSTIRWPDMSGSYHNMENLQVAENTEHHPMQGDYH